MGDFLHKENYPAVVMICANSRLSGCWLDIVGATIGRPRDFVKQNHIADRR